MPLKVPSGYANMTIGIRNIGGGISGRSSFAIGLSLQAALTQTDVDRVSNLVRDAIKPLWDNQWEVGPTHFYEGGAVPRAWDDASVEVGTHVADTYAPPQVATVVAKLTGMSGKRYRGRIYLPGVPSGNVGEDGGINPTYASSVTTIFNAMNTALIADAAVAIPVVFHDESVLGVDPTPILTWAARSRAGTMRPRQRR